MKRLLIAFAALLLLAVAAWASVTCSRHNNAPCYGTGQVRQSSTRVTFEEYRCNCGDTYWVAK